MMKYAFKYLSKVGRIGPWSHIWDLEFNAYTCKRLHKGNQPQTDTYFMKCRHLGSEQITNVEEEVISVSLSTKSYNSMLK